MNDAAGLKKAGHERAWVSRLSTTVLVAVATACSSTTGVKGVSIINVSPPTATLLVHDQLVLHAQVLDQSGGALGSASVFWSSDDTTIAPVSSTGVVTAMAPGVVHIAASADGVSGTATITVSATKVASVTVVPDTLRLAPGGASRLLATAYNASGDIITGLAVTWGSSNTAVATVDQTGAVTAITDGTSTISASIGGQIGSAVTIVSVPKVATVTIVPDTLTVAVGATSQLQATAYDDDGRVLSGLPITWGSGNTAIATVDTLGNVTGVGPGTTQVSAAIGGKTGIATVIVTPLVPVTINGCHGGTLTEDTAASIVVNGNIDGQCKATLTSKSGSIEIKGNVDNASSATLVAATSVAIDQQVQGGSNVQVTAGTTVTLGQNVMGQPNNTDTTTLAVFNSTAITIAGDVAGGALAKLRSQGQITIGGSVHDPGTQVLWWGPSPPTPPIDVVGGVMPPATVVEENWGGF
jgi:trimeric autotransporter adhesin